MAHHKAPPESPHSDKLLGAVVALAGIAVAIAMYLKPESLQVPLWLALVACLCFVLSGLALSLKATRFTRSYHLSVVALLLCMTCIPAWLAFGSGVRTCTATIPLMDGDAGCRLAFAVATAIMLPILGLAIKQAALRRVF